MIRLITLTTTRSIDTQVSVRKFLILCACILYEYIRVVKTVAPEPNLAP